MNNVKYSYLREIRRIRVFRHHVKSVSVSSQSCLQFLSLNIQVVKSVFSATLFKSFSVYEIHPSSQSLMHFFSFQRTSHHTRKRWILRILWSHGVSSSYIFFFFFVLDNWFLQISWRHIASVELGSTFSITETTFTEMQASFSLKRQTRGSRLKPRRKVRCKRACTLLNSFTDK